MRASSSTSDESSRTCPSGSVGAGVGWEQRCGIRIVNATASACKRLIIGVSGTWWQTCQCSHVRAAGVEHAAAAASKWASIMGRQYQVSTRGVCNGLQSPGAGVRA